jgi:hypothetical protein
MAFDIHHSLCDYVAGMGSLESSLVGVYLLCILMVGHFIIVMTQKIQSLLMQQVTEHGNVP